MKVFVVLVALSVAACSPPTVPHAPYESGEHDIPVRATYVAGPTSSCGGPSGC